MFVCIKLKKKNRVTHIEIHANYDSNHISIYYDTPYHRYMRI